MQGRWKLIAATVSVLGATTIGACLAEIGVSNKEIQIATSNALSGQSEWAGKETNIGIQSYFNLVNADGGIFGRKVKVMNYDDKYEPDEAIQVFKKIESDGAFGITGVYGSPVSAKYLPLSTLHKFPIAGFYNGTYFVGEPVKKYVFSARASYRDEMHEAVDHLWKESGFRKFACIYQNDAYGVDCLEGLKEGLKKYNTDVVSTASYTRNHSDVVDAVNEVRKSNPDVVFLGAVYKPAAQIVKLAREANWNPIFVMNSGSSVDAFVGLAGPDAEGKLFTEVVPPPSRTDLPLIEKFQKALKKYYPDEKPGFVNLRGFMDGLVWTEGLKRAGKEVTREKFVNAMEGIKNLDVGLGNGMELSYSPTDHLGLHKVFFGTFKNGQTVSFDAWKSLKK
jgi:ABC-type branched-subunit amino acid transport system substrate-binding protein